jgi:trk system potassium uptake protein
MNIVIYGASRLGIYLADVLSKNGHNLTMVDNNPSILERASRNSDIGVKTVSNNNWKVLEELMEDKPDMLLALTNIDELNICLCSIAKHLGYQYTVAKLDSYGHGAQSNVDLQRVFNVDHFIAPNILAAFDIFERIVNPGALKIETFAHGDIQMRTLKVPATWDRAGKTLEQLELPREMRIALIKRGLNKSKIIFPHGPDKILPDDEVTVIGQGQTVLEEGPVFFGITAKKVRSVVIIGASPIGIHLSQLLTDYGVYVRLIESDSEKSHHLARDLDNVNVISHDGGDFNFLLAEKLDQADAVVIATGTDSFNLMTGALAKRAGAKEVIAVFQDQSLKPIVDELDLINEVSPWTSALRRIASIIDKHANMAETGMYEGQVVMLEAKVTEKARAAGLSLDELSAWLPNEFLVMAIESRGYLQVASGSSVLCPHDTVIAVTTRENRKIVESLL